MRRTNQILLSLGILSLAGCNAGSTSGSTNTPSQCPIDAPLFTQQIGEQLIDAWGVNATKYSPTGSAGYTDPYVGAAYFTGVQYLSNAVLLPTVSPVTRVGSQVIYNYFTKFLTNNPVMTNIPLTDGTTLSDCGVGVISGYYDFLLSPSGSTPSTVNARYTFQFQYLSMPTTVAITVESGVESGTVITVPQPAGWYIMLQNSAQLPSGSGVKPDLLIP